MRLRRPLLALLAGLCLAGAAAADTFVMLDGRRIQGTLVREEGGDYVVRTNLGEIKIAKAHVKEILRGKTDAQLYAEKEAAARTAQDFYELGNWALERKMSSGAKKAWRRAVELDGDHAGAREALGFVRHGGEWMTPEERDARVAEEQADAMRARGLVLHEGRWVTPEERRHLEAGRVFVDGRWVDPDAAKRLAGLEVFEGTWMPKAEAEAREAIAQTAGVAGVALSVAVTDDAAVAGPFGAPFLADIGAALTRGRAWFDGAYGAEPGLGLFGGRLALIYVWGRDGEPYLKTIPHFAALTPTVPEGWAAAVAKTHGLLWWDPYPLSSARLWHRPESDLSAHCAHHFGHLLLNRLGYDGRLLPPWYDEGLAALFDFKLSGTNRVFCRGGLAVSRGTSAATAGFDFDPGLFREGGWRTIVQDALRAGRVPRLDRIAALDFSQLELLDVAVSMAILEWLEHRGGLRAFHDALRRAAPEAPVRVLPTARERQAVYDRAFQAAVQTTWREADEAWRAWFESR